MTQKKIVFVAYQDQENLGVGYLSSILISKGFNVEIIDFHLGYEEIYQRLRKTDPFLVGFSLIFQYYTARLQELIKILRDKGINSHFTVGGHYPSLSYKDVLNSIPGLDSVVRFEGEHTICELAKKLMIGENWTIIKGIAYRKQGKPVSNELRALIENLDSLPFPYRSKENPYECLDKKCAFILANRGCIWNCAFCSIRKFYSTPPGKLRRSRSPGNVVREMKELYEKNIRIFLFQDDDFFSPGKFGEVWINTFINRLKKEGIAENILWKISCRSDEVDFELFQKLKKIGLCLVYLGIESGNPTGLKILNKHLTVDDSIRATKNLNKLDILWDFGFMLWDPSSTFQSVRANIEFLKNICREGFSPVTFCKTLPYAGTDIERALKNQGRLKGSIIMPDYNLLDARLEKHCRFLHEIFYDWIFRPNGLLEIIRHHRLEIKILEKFYPHAKGLIKYKDFVKKIIASSNELFFEIAEKSTDIFEEDNSYTERQVLKLEKILPIEQNRIHKKLIDGMRQFHQQQLN